MRICTHFKDEDEMVDLDIEKYESWVKHMEDKYIFGKYEINLRNYIFYIFL